MLYDPYHILARDTTSMSDWLRAGRGIRRRELRIPLLRIGVLLLLGEDDEVYGHSCGSLPLGAT